MTVLFIHRLQAYFIVVMIVIMMTTKIMKKKEIIFFSFCFCDQTLKF
jgi:hypothetical protein